MAFRKQAVLALALVSAILCLGCTDEIGSPVATDEQPVLPPTAVTAFALNDGHVRVTWDASSEPTINGYNLYRSETGQGSPVRVNTKRIMNTQYIDTHTEPLREYEYRVTAVNVKGRESQGTTVVIETTQHVSPGTHNRPATATD